jgi:hypothetical protein
MMELHDAPDVRGRVVMADRSALLGGHTVGPVFGDLPACTCRLHSRDNDTGWDEGDRKLVSDVQGHGWHLVGIPPRPGQPSWVFSVGLWHTFRTPEVAMFGLQMSDMGVWINRVGDQMLSDTLIE